MYAPQPSITPVCTVVAHPFKKIKITNTLKIISKYAQAGFCLAQQ